MRKVYILLVLAVLLAGFTLSVIQKERGLAKGRDVLLALAPVDPRALLMGDYMTLEYSINAAIRKALLGRERSDSKEDHKPSGRAVVHLFSDAGNDRLENVLEFIRLDNGTPLLEGEFYLAYRVWGTSVVTAAPAFYFHEGQGKIYERARYGRLRLDDAGGSLLVALCDAFGRDIVSNGEENRP